MRFAKDFLLPHRSECLRLFFLNLSGALLQLPMPLLIIVLVDKVLPMHAQFYFFLTVAAIATAIFARALLAYLAERASLCFREHVILELENRLFNAVLRMPISFFENNQSGYLASRIISDSRSADSSLITTLQSIIVSGLTLLAASCALATISLHLLLIWLAFGLPYAALRLYATRTMRDMSVKLQESTALSYGAITESIAGVKLLQLFTFEKHQSRYIHHRLTQAMHAFLRVNIFGYLSQFGSSSMLGAATIAVILYSGWHALHGLMTVGTFFAVISLVAMLFSPLDSLIASGMKLQQSAGVIDRIYALLDKVSPPVLSEYRHISRPCGHLECRNVTFAYDSGQPVLDNVSFCISPNSITALVGRSGAGKSTLVNLITRIYEVAEGTIHLDGIDIATIHPTEVRSYIGVVDQIPFLFHRTILSNLLIGRPDATLADVRLACEKANILHFISSLPMGFDTVVGANGLTLSAGQAQRICLARLLLRNPPIIILDEATSAVDSTSEADMQETIQTMRTDHTIIVIAHRLSTVVAADRVLLLTEGRLTEEGTHVDLLSRQGHYADLFRAQWSLACAAQ